MTAQNHELTFTTSVAAELQARGWVLTDIEDKYLLCMHPNENIIFVVSDPFMGMVYTARIIWLEDDPVALARVQDLVEGAESNRVAWLDEGERGPSTYSSCEAHFLVSVTAPAAWAACVAAVGAGEATVEESDNILLS